MSLGHSKGFIHIFPYNNSEADNYEFSHLADENIEQIVIMLLAQDHMTNNGWSQPGQSDGRVCFSVQHYLAHGMDSIRSCREGKAEAILAL